MLLTEDEAKQKQCCGPPAAAAATYYSAGATVEAPALCIASGCMAWRWQVTPQTAEKFRKAREENPKSQGPTVARGWCGLAGDPGGYDYDIND